MEINTLKPGERERWGEFYEKTFGVRPSIFDGVIPAICFDKHLSSPLFMDPSISSVRIVEVAKDIIEVESYITEFENIVSKGIPTSPYITWCADSEEVDAMQLGIPAEECIKLQMTGMTFEERLIFGLKRYFDGKLTDTKTETLCIGSENRKFGTIPMVYSQNGHLVLSICHPMRTKENIGARIVSLRS